MQSLTLTKQYISIYINILYIISKTGTCELCNFIQELCKYID